IGAIPVSKLRYAGKIFDAVSDAFKWRARVKAARRSFPELEGEIRAEQAKLTSCLGGNSFVPGTLVLLADGSTKPIEEVELGARGRCERARVGGGHDRRPRPKGPGGGHGRCRR